MANEQIEYIDPDSHFYLFEIPFARCSFGGILYERRSVGFDLYLSMGPSDVEHLELVKITWMRNQGDSNKEIFIDHYEDAQKFVGSDLFNFHFGLDKALRPVWV